MSLSSGLEIAQILGQVLTLLAGVFFAGRIFERISQISHRVEAMHVALGLNGQPGSFIRRSEVELMQKQAIGEHEALDHRITELAARIGSVEGRAMNR